MGTQQVIISHARFSYADEKYRGMLDEWFRYDTPGVAPLAFLGYPDHGPKPESAEALRALAPNVPPVVVAEIKPDGCHLSESASLTEREAVHLAIALCEMALVWASRVELLTVGVRPETVYISGDPGHRVFTGTTPRIALMGSNDEVAFSWHRYCAPSLSYQIGVDDMAFIIAMVTWFALVHDDPYVGNEIWIDKRRPYTGPPEIGAILERVLVGDETRRLGARGFRDALVSLAQRLGAGVPERTT